MSNNCTLFYIPFHHIYKRNFSSEIIDKLLDFCHRMLLHEMQRYTSPHRSCIIAAMHGMTNGAQFDTDERGNPLVMSNCQDISITFIENPMLVAGRRRGNGIVWHFTVTHCSLLMHCSNRALDILTRQEAALNGDNETANNDRGDIYCVLGMIAMKHGLLMQSLTWSNF